jgi:uncharacterized membrane protein
MEKQTPSPSPVGAPSSYRNIISLAAILVLPFLVLLALAALGALPWKPATYGRLSLALLFLVTGLGHFLQTEGMAAMLPPWIPARRLLIQASGLLEWALGAAVLVPAWAPWPGLAVVAFLVAIFPSNVYAALHRVPFGGHAQGPRYLIPRGVLQLVLIAWAWGFAVLLR